MYVKSLCLLPQLISNISENKKVEHFKVELENDIGVLFQHFSDSCCFLHHCDCIVYTKPCGCLLGNCIINAIAVHRTLCKYNETGVGKVASI